MNISSELREFALSGKAEVAILGTGDDELRKGLYALRHMIANSEEKHSGLTFGAALSALKEGYRVAREGWNGKGMWIGLVKADNYIVFTAPHGDGQDTPEGECKGLLPWLGMKTADNKFVPWLASQTDMLADDWTLVLEEKHCGHPSDEAEESLRA